MSYFNLFYKCSINQEQKDEFEFDYEDDSKQVAHHTHNILRTSMPRYELIYILFAKITSYMTVLDQKLTI